MLPVQRWSDCASWPPGHLWPRHCLFYKDMPSQWHDLFSESLEDLCLYFKLKQLIHFSSIQLVVGWVFFLLKLKFCNSSIPLVLCQLHFELPNGCASSVLLVLCMGGSQLKLTICSEVTSSKLKPIIIFTRRHQQWVSISGVSTNLHFYIKLDHEGKNPACHLLSHVFLF